MNLFDEVQFHHDDVITISRDEVMKKAILDITIFFEDIFNETKSKPQHVIVVGELFTVPDVFKLVQSEFKYIPIHRFTEEDIGRGACQRAIEIHDFFEKGIDIEFDIVFKY